MTLQQAYDKIEAAGNPKDFFGPVANKDELQDLFREFSLRFHPDRTQDKTEKELRTKFFQILTEMYFVGKEQLDNGSYLNPAPKSSAPTVTPTATYDVSDLEKLKPRLIFTKNGKEYKIYEQIYENAITKIFVGLCGKEKIQLNVARESKYNDYIMNEYEVLKKLSHFSIPVPLAILNINDELEDDDKLAFVMTAHRGDTIDEIMKKKPYGIDQRHVTWILERLFENIGYLHSKCVIHGNLRPDNIVINKDNHGVGLTGFEFCVDEANKPGARYKIMNKFYSAPEINKTIRTTPDTDIYSIGQIAILLLGGNVQTGELPASVNTNLQRFLRSLIGDHKTRPNDAWKLWDEIRHLRKDVMKVPTFEKFDY